LESKDIDHRINVVGAIGDIGPAAATAVDALTKVAETDRFPRVRDGATAALKKLRTKPRASQ
jgi:hypothetical protein